MYHSRVRWYQVQKIVRWYHLAFTLRAGTKYHSHARWYHEPFAPFSLVLCKLHTELKHFLLYKWKTFHFSSSIWIRGLHFLVIQGRMYYAFGVSNINTEMERLAGKQAGKNSGSDRLQAL